VLLCVWVLEISVRVIFMRHVLFLHSEVKFVLCNIVLGWLKVNTQSTTALAICRSAVERMVQVTSL
jgi:hypothetical protein